MHLMAPDQVFQIRLCLTKVHCGFAVQDMRVQCLECGFDSIQTCFAPACVTRNGQAFGEFCNNTGGPIDEPVAGFPVLPNSATAGLRPVQAEE
jgi:hypothetical protein